MVSPIAKIPAQAGQPDRVAPRACLKRSQDRERLTCPSGAIRIARGADLRMAEALALSSRDGERAEALARALRDEGADARPVTLDLAAPGGAETVVQALAASDLRITHLVNNARTLDTLAVGADGRTGTEDFLGEFNIDVVQPYRLTMALAADPAHGLRAVVNVGSQYGEVAPNPALYGGTLDRSPVQYGVAKAALHHLTRELAARLAPAVRVNCVAFGGFAGRAPADFVARYAAMVPNRRMLDDAEAGGPVAFLLSDAASAVNGHVLVADGGWSIW